MAKFQIKAPDGAEYEVDAPDGVSESDVLAHLQSQAGGAQTDPYAGMSTDQLRGEYRKQQKMGNKAALPKIADAFVRKEGESASTLGQIGIAADDVIRQTAKGVPVLGGLLDEGNAALSSLMGGDYEESLDYNRARDRRVEKALPWGTAATQLAGGIAGTIAGARTLGVPYAINSTRTLPARLLTGAAVGAPVGAADFFARGEGGAQNRTNDALLGAGFGGVIGAAAPAVAQGIASGASRVANFLTSDAFLRRLGISREAANVLIRQLSTDDTLTQTGAQRIRDAGPDGMLADAGPAATNLLDTALERSGPGSTAAREAIETRAGQEAARTTATLDQTLGPPVGVETRQAGIRQGTAGARSSAYDTAYAQPIDYASQGGRDVEALLNRVPQEAINQANRLMRAEGQASRQIMARMNPDGTVTFERMPDVRQLDYITRALNEVARGAEGQGALGGTTAAGRIYGNLARDIRQRLRQDDLVPEYGVALDTAADPIRRIQATEFGATILNKGTTREQVAREMQGMTGPERQAAMSGLRDAVDELVANVKTVASDPNLDARQLRETLNALSSDAVREKLTLVIGQAAANRLFVSLGRASRAIELRASTARNSRTFGRNATDAQVKAQTEPGVIGLAMQGNPVQAVRKALQTLTGMTPERRLAAEDQLYGEISRALTQVRGTQAEQYLQTLLRAVQARSRNQRAGRAAGTLGADALVGSAATPADRLVQPVQP